mgnify:FL=1
MLRFKPDDWLEGLLRPFILADPNGFIYIEIQAPDLRFAALGALTVVLLIARRLSATEARPVSQTLVGMWLVFYIWVYVIGNGRYFIAGLLLVGPLLVALLARAPFTPPMRLTVLTGLLGLQAMVVHQHFVHGAWTLAQWTGSGPGLPLRDTPLRREPAGFLATTNISLSILVPQFDPRSRWANIAGQGNITPDKPEWATLNSLLATSLPKYAVLPILTRAATERMQPNPEVDQMLQRILGRYGLTRGTKPCEVIESHLRAPNLDKSNETTRPLAYWFCAVEVGSRPQPQVPPSNPSPWRDVFAAVEQACPRFFPPGGGEEAVVSESVALRYYAMTDTRLYVDRHGNVMYRYLRAINPTRIGSIDDVRRGEFNVDCDKLPGRYRYPWQH